MPRALPRRPALAKKATTGAVGDDPHRLDGQELRIAGPDPDAVEPALRSFGLARERVDRRRRHRAAALAAAHRRWPGRPLCDQRLLRFRRADEADRHADDRSRARRAGGDAVRAGETAPSARCRSRRPRRRAAAARGRSPPRCASCRAFARAPASTDRPSVQIDLVVAGRRARVTPSATMRASQKIGAPALSARAAASAAPGEKTRSAAASTIPQAWMIRTATRSSSGENRASSASRADDGEGAAIDRRAVLLVIVARFHAAGLSPLNSARAFVRPAARRSPALVRPRRAGGSARLSGDDEVIAVFGRDQRRGRSKRPRAALGAAADMQNDAIALAAAAPPSASRPRATRDARACRRARRDRRRREAAGRGHGERSRASPKP